MADLGLMLVLLASKGWTNNDEKESKSGGQGEVTQVKNIYTDALGAIKTLHKENVSNSERRKRFVREVEALKKVEGNGIPKIIDHNIEDVDDVKKLLYIITEWIEGKTLTSFTNNKPIPFQKALELMIELCHIIKRCHQNKVYHRDIKPDNIMIDTNGKLYLVDFGISYIDEELDEKKSELTKIGQELGNRFFRLPDFSAGRENRDSRSDITLVVGVLFYLVTGLFPRTLADEKGLPPHRSLKNKIEKKIFEENHWNLLERIFEVGFQLDVDLRFQTVDELINRISEILNPIDEEEVSVPRIDDEVIKYQEILNSQVTKAWQDIESAMLEGSLLLENELRELASSNGLQSIHNSAFAWISEPGKKAEFTYRLVRIGKANPMVDLHHFVQLTGDKNSYVEASYRLENGEAIIYYTGLAADKGRLKEELIKQKDVIFARTLEILNNKISSIGN